MFTRSILRTRVVIRRFCHNKINNENNKIVEDLLRQQNEYLKNISDSIPFICVCVSSIPVAIHYHR